MSRLELMPGLFISCDHTGCKAKPTVVPQVWIPEPGWCAVDTTKHGIKRYLPLHFCDRHKHRFDFDALLTDTAKASFERLALTKWGSSKLDFEKGWVSWVNVRDPDYIAYLAKESPRLVPVARQHIAMVTAKPQQLRRAGLHV